jgi:DMSO reductase anchor subunit
MRVAEYAFAFQAGGLMLLVIAVVAMSLFFANKRKKRKQDLIAQFLEKGQEVPPMLLPPPPSKPRELRRGIWLASLGLGIGSVLYIATGDWRVASSCLILLFLSVASFINAAVFYGDHGSSRRTVDSD